MVRGQALILDMHSLAWKAYHTPAYKKLTTTAGEPSGMFYGVLASIHKVLKRFPAAVRVLCAYDSGHSGRNDIFPSYKGTRLDDPENPSEARQAFRLQMVALTNFLEDVGFHRLAESGVEADDLIAIYAQAWVTSHRKNSVVIVSIDSDFYQLLGVSTRIGFYNHRTSVFLDYKNIGAHIPVDVQLYAHYKALIGDTADNIPRCLTHKQALAFLAEPEPEARMTEPMRRNLALVRLPYVHMPRLRSMVNVKIKEVRLEEAQATLTLMSVKAFNTSHFGLPD